MPIRGGKRSTLVDVLTTFGEAVLHWLNDADISRMFMMYTFSSGHEVLLLVRQGLTFSCSPLYVFAFHHSLTQVSIISTK